MKNFTESIIKELKNYLPKNLKDMIFENLNELKIKCILPNKGISLTICLDEFYKEFCIGKDFYTICEEVAEEIQTAFTIEDFSLTKIKEKLFCVVINCTMNKELLKSVPYTIIKETETKVSGTTLAFVYRFHLNNQYSAIITNKHLNFWGISVSELHEIAIKNTPALLGIHIESMIEVMENIKEKDSVINVDEIINSFRNIPENQQMMVISNNNNLFGASTIFFNNFEILKKIAEKFNDDLYIIPSSIHEVLVFSYSAYAENIITNNEIREVNDTLDKKDVLSDYLMVYNKDENRLLFAE